MYLAILHYKVPREEREPYLEKHRAFLQEGYAKGDFVVSGPLLNGKGGIIFSTCTRRGEFEQLLQKDPFKIQDLADYEIVGFEPTKFHPDFSCFIRERDKEEIELVPHNPNWKHVFEAEKEALSSILKDTLIDVHHIGSTAIPGIHAKPIIDILPVVRDVHDVDRVSDAFEALGYEVKGEFGISGRRFFTKRTNGKRTFNVHIFEKDHPAVDRHLHFRDYMLAHPEDAQAYSDIKKKLVTNCPNDLEKYCWGKNDFVKVMEIKAAKWRKF